MVSKKLPSKETRLNKETQNSDSAKRHWLVRFVDYCYRAWLDFPFGLIFLICPQAWRFALAQRLAILIWPFVRLLLAYRGKRWDGYREASLRNILLLMDRAGVQFDSKLRVVNANLLTNQPTIIVGGHFNLNILFSRWLYDQERPASNVRATVIGQPRIFGTRIPLDVIKGDEMVLVKIRNKLKAGRVVIIYLDSNEPHARSIRIETPSGILYVSNTVFELAKKINIPILFGCVRVDQTGQAIATFAQPESSDIEAMRQEFCDFLFAQSAACS